MVPAAEQRASGVLLRSEDAAVRARRHLLRDASPAVRQRCERDGVLQRAVGSDRRLDRFEDLRRDEGRTESRWLVRAGGGHQRRWPHHGAAMESDYRARRIAPLCGRHHGRQRTWRSWRGRRRERRGRRTGSQARYARELQSLRRDSEPCGRFHLGRGRTLPRVPRASRPRQESAAVVHGGDLQGAGARLRSARCGHRYQRRRLDGARRQQPPRELRSPEVQADHRAAQGRWQRVRGRVDAL